MKKCIVIPDSFKGTLSSEEVCRIVSDKIREIEPGCEVVAIPVADGGEGTVDCFLYAADAKKIEVETQGPYGETVAAYYARMGDTAVIEMAQAAGLRKLKEGRIRADFYLWSGVDSSARGRAWMQEAGHWTGRQLYQ